MQSQDRKDQDPKDQGEKTINISRIMWDFLKFLFELITFHDYGSALEKGLKKESGGSKEKLGAKEEARRERRNKEQMDLWLWKNTHPGYEEAVKGTAKEMDNSTLLHNQPKVMKKSINEINIDELIVEGDKKNGKKPAMDLSTIKREDDIEDLLVESGKLKKKKL